MKLRILSITLIVCLAWLLAACGGRDAEETTNALPAPTSTAGGNTPPTATDEPASPTAPPAQATDTVEAPTAAPSDTPTSEPTTTSAPRPRATPTNIGPLDFQFFLAGCSRAPTADKPGNLKISISIEARGGNGIYQYFYEGAQLPGKFFDVERELGNSINGKATVVSGNQTVEKEWFFAATDVSAKCP